MYDTPCEIKAASSDLIVVALSGRLLATPERLQMD